MDNELDTDWFDKQMNIEKHYDDFYNSCVENVNVTMIFVNENNTVSCIKREIVAINNGTFPRSKIVELVKTCKSKSLFPLTVKLLNISSE